jgi:hypothetical protein
MHAAEAAVGAALHVAVPAHALQRALRQGRAATLHRSRRTLRFTLIGAAAAAAAAIVLLAVSLVFKPASPVSDFSYKIAAETDVPRPGTDVPVSDLICSLKSVSDIELDIDLLSEEFEREAFGITALTDVVGETEETPDAQGEEIREFQEDDLWNVPDGVESTDPIEAY